MMKDIEVCLSQMSNDELETLIKKATTYKKNREKERFEELRKNFLDAFNVLLQEFPYTTCIVNVHIDGEDLLWNEANVDLLHHLKRISPDCIDMC